MSHIYGQTPEQEMRFKRICDGIKNDYAQRGETLSDVEAAQAANNLIGYVELLVKIRRGKINDGHPDIIEELVDLKARYEAGDPQALEKVQSITDERYTAKKFFKQLDNYLKDKKKAA